MNLSAKLTLLLALSLLGSSAALAGPPMEAAAVRGLNNHPDPNRGPSCFGPGPLLVVSLDSIALDRGPDSLGEWSLPMDPSHPEKKTAAKLQLELVRSEGASNGGWAARANFTFNDPKPYGIPFTFQKIELTWVTAGSTYSADQDWSRACEGAGLALFPGQNTNSTFVLTGAQDSWTLDRPILRLWGSRN